MTTLAGFLAELGRLDVRLVLDGDTVRVDAPAAAMTPEIRARLVERKAELVAHLRSAAAASAGGTAPVSPGQRRVWSLAKLKADAGVYNVPTAFRLTGPLDVRALEASLAEVQRRHEPLRTVFDEVDGQPVQRVLPAGPVKLEVTDLADGLAPLDAAARDQAILHRAQLEVARPFDLASGPVWRAAIWRIAPDDFALVLTMHHIAFDGRSKPIFLREIGDAYRSYASGREPALTPLPVRYADFAAWQEAAANDAEATRLDYWKRQLGGEVSECELPADRPRPASPSQGARSATFALPDALAKAVRALSRQEIASPYITLLAAFAALLSVRTGQEDLLLCSPFASRDRAEFEGLIGYLNSIVVLRVDVSGSPAFHELVGRVRRVALEAFKNQHVPLQRLAELPGLVRVPLARVLFSYQDTSTRTLDLGEVRATPIHLRKGESDFDLALYAEGTHDGGIGIVVEYSADRFDDATIDRLLRDYARLLDAVVADPHRHVADLPGPRPDVRDVEAQLASHRQIDRAAVVRRPGHVGSIAYLVLNEDDVPRLEDIRAFLRGAFPDYLVPSTLVPVDRMPLHADGSIDLAALPPPPALRSRAARPYAAPRSALERRLAAVWKRVLWLDDDVGIDDSFADLGGHSLLSAQLVVEVERELGRPLPLRALAELDTVAAMARILEEAPAAPAVPATPAVSGLAPSILHDLRTYTASWAGERATPESLIVGLNTAGTRPPLFWCLQRHQEMTQLARYLGPDQPVYGMRSGNRVMEKSGANIAALAGHYVDEILGLLPSGPLVVGGNCQAARIALQIARQLADRGREPDLLFMHEKFVPKPYAGRVALMFGRESDRNPYRQFARPEAGWRKYYTGPQTFDLVEGQHAEFFVEPNVQVLTDTIRRRIDDLAGAPPPAAAPPMQRLPAEGYQARFAVRGPTTVRAGGTLRLEVTVTNQSPIAWRGYAQSGIALVNRWTDEHGKTLAWLDGWSPLPAEVAAGEGVVMHLDATAPQEAGRHLLILDLVDEGVTLFSSRGSKVAAIRVEVTGAPPPAATDYNAAPLRGAPGA